MKPAPFSVSESNKLTPGEAVLKVRFAVSELLVALPPLRYGDWWLLFWLGFCSLLLLAQELLPRLFWKEANRFFFLASVPGDVDPVGGICVCI